MRAVVLETDVLGPASQRKYDDRLTSYQFPRQYLKCFAPLSDGQEMLAVIYEPRGTASKGRMAYVGWATLRGAPNPDPGGSRSTYRVDCVEPMRTFEKPVPREVNGEPIERWLRDKPRGRYRNIATLGRAVRRITAKEVEDIFRLGATNLAWDADDRERAGELTTSEDRLSRIVKRLERSAQFRANVLASYGNRCAVSGLSSGGMGGLIEAAHIKGAGRPDYGPDHVTNGVALTPTLHRLFDRHLFSFRYAGDELIVVTSNQLTMKMVENSKTGSRLAVEDGQKVRLPLEISTRPRSRFVDYHRRRLER